MTLKSKKMEWKIYIEFIRLSPDISRLFQGISIVSQFKVTRKNSREIGGSVSVARWPSW